MKKLVTALLVAAILSLSAPRASAPEKDNCLTCVVAVMVIVIGGVCIYGIWKCCKLLNQLDPPPPPSPPPTNNIPTNYPPAWTNPSAASLPLSLITTSTIATIQQSLGLGDWADIITLSMTNYADQVVLSSGSLCLTSTVVNGVAYFFLPPVSQPPSDSRFFRLLSTP